MIHVSSPTAQKFDRVKRKGVAFLSGLFRTKRLIVGMKIDEEDKMERPRIETPAIVSNRIPSSLSVAAVDVVLSPSSVSQSSPSHSILTLTPGRTRNIDQDMEALRLSRQDNPFLQILASRESLIESMEESESDDAILMSQELGDADPLTLAQVHEHLVRSPPPASWPMTPAFPFSPVPVDNSCPLAITRYKTPSPSKNTCCKRDRITDSSTLSKSEPSNDLRVTDRHTHTFSLLNPTPIRTLSEVRRLHRSADDNVQLMSSE
ncbi:GSCOCG00003555001-RA-CDS [Cotesia congregata]|nr:GSCOCG00003555001-RA-CDS [Cotesia congregata]